MPQTITSDGSLNGTEGVQTILNRASTAHGDTIKILASTYPWAQGTLVITKAVKIEGAGPLQTKLQDARIQFDGGTNGAPNWPAGTHPRLTNLTIQWNGTLTVPSSTGIVNFTRHVREFEIDHVGFEIYPNPPASDKGTACFRTASSFWGWGLVHHCHFSKFMSGDFIECDQPSWLPLEASLPVPSLAFAKGDGSWADYNYWAGVVPVNGTYLGLAKTAGASLTDGSGNPLMPCFRFEDNIFEQPDFSLTTLSGGGSRREVRFNTFYYGQVGGHGAETNHPGGRSTEYYNNLHLRSTNQTQGPYQSRACSSVVFNNRANNCFTIDRATAYRSTFYGDAYGSPDGANPWDLNKTGTFTDVWGNTYTVKTAGDHTKGHGDIYWSGQYTGPTITLAPAPTPNNTSPANSTSTVPLANLNTANGTGPTIATRRWKGFQLRNVTLHNRILSGGFDTRFMQTGIMIDSCNSAGTALICSGAGPKQWMEIRTNDQLEIRMVDMFIHQAGNGKGDLLETYANPVPDFALWGGDDSSPMTGARPPTPPPNTNPPPISWNMTLDKRAYPRDTVEGMWFWHNKCSQNSGGSYTSADRLNIIPPNESPPSSNVNVSDNAQQFRLDRNVFIPGQGLLSSVDPTQTAGRPPNYPYDSGITGSDTKKRLRIGADDEAYSTFGFPTPYPTIQQGNANAAASYWGRTYPDYLRGTSPAVSGGSGNWIVGTIATITTSNFVGTPNLAIAWDTTPANTAFNTSPPVLPGQAKIVGSSTSPAAGQYVGTITASVVSPEQSVTNTFTLNVNAANIPPTCVLNSPATGSTFTAPATITLTATATDQQPGYVSKVEFYRGGSTLITNPNGDQAIVTISPYTFTWTNVAAGSYSITAKAYDDTTGVTTSTASSITVNPAPSVLQPPNIVVTA